MEKCNEKWRKLIATTNRLNRLNKYVFCQYSEPICVYGLNDLGGTMSMKHIKILFGAAIISLATMITGNAQIIIQNNYPPMTLNISGVFAWDSNFGFDHGAYFEWEMVKVRFTTKDLIKLLNNSATFTNVLNHVTGVTQIPAGSFLKIDINQPVIFQWWNEWAIFVTNRNGFSFQLNDVYDPVQGDYYTFLDVYHDYAVGSSKFLYGSYAGQETDMAAIHFTFDNGEETFFEFFGVGDFKWIAAPGDYIFAGTFSQKVSVAGKIVGGGNAMYNYKPAVMQATLTFEGLGMVESFQPFEMWNNRNTWDSILGFPPLVR